MTSEKKVRKAVAKPRLLKAILATMEEHDLGVDATCGALVDAVKDDIVTAAMNT